MSESVPPPDEVAPSLAVDGIPTAAEGEEAAGAEEAAGELVDFQNRTRSAVRLGFACLLAVVVAAGYFIKVDYVALVPGSATDTEPLVLVEGVESFPSDGEILFTTVRLRQEPNLFEYFWTKFDDDAELVPAEIILGDRTPDENREINLQLMTDSKQLAVAVALEQLGYDTISSDGVVVADVLPDTAADGVLNLGDTIVSVDGEPILTALDLIDLLKTHSPGDQMRFGLQRFTDGAEEEVEVTMGAREDDETVAFLGIVPQDRVSVADELPIDVEIESGAVGGPSAGLAFTLAILDQLTDGELTGGNDVAVTGTIAFDGRVGSVGGVPQKTAAVRDMGIDHFIVPSALGEELLAEIEERAGPDLTIIPVETLDEALAALAELGGNVDSVDDFAAVES